MKRKVIKQGNGTLTITLPKGWTKKVGLTGNDEIEVVEQGNSLFVGEHRGRIKQEITLDVSGLDRTTILILLQGVYRYGYDQIEIVSKDNNVPHHRTGKKVSISEIVYSMANRMIGAEVISASDRRFVIKRLVEESIDDFPTALRRIFLLLNEMIESFIDGVKKKDLEIMKSMEFKHTNLKNFINFCLRLLNKFGYEDSKKTCFYFNIISLLSKAEDIIKNNSRYILKYGIRIDSSQSIGLLKDISKSLQIYYELFYKYNNERLALINEHRDIFREKLIGSSKQLSKEENLVLGGMSQIVELVLDMTETRMALEG